MNASGTSFDTESNHSCTDAELTVAPIPFGLVTSSTKDNLKSILNLRVGRANAHHSSMASASITPCVHSKDVDVTLRRVVSCRVVRHSATTDRDKVRRARTNVVPMDMRWILTPSGRRLKGSSSTVGGSSHKLQQYQPDTPMTVPTTSSSCEQHHFNPPKNATTNDKPIKRNSEQAPFAKHTKIGCSHTHTPPRKKKKTHQHHDPTNTARTAQSPNPRCSGNIREAVGLCAFSRFDAVVQRQRFVEARLFKSV